jgi:hypothetical protein
MPGPAITSIPAVQVTKSGIDVTDGSLIRATIGLLPDGTYGIGLFDAYGGTLLNPNGFGPSWSALVQSGIFNNLFVKAVPGLLAIGTSRDDPAGLTDQLPFWTVWRATGAGTATVVTDATYPGGVRIDMTYSATGSAVAANVAITSALFPIEGLTGFRPIVAYANNVPAGVTLEVSFEVLWYDVNGVFISSIDANTMGTDGPQTNALALNGGFPPSPPAMAPANARFARAEINTWEGAGHSIASLNSIGMVTTAPVYDDVAVFAEVDADIIQANSQLNVLGTFTADGQVTMAGVIAPAITSSQNDWAPTGYQTCNRIELGQNAPYVITGLNATATGLGRTILLQNVSGFSVTLSHRSASSTSANRFSCPDSMPFVVAPHGSVYLVYGTDLWSVVTPGNPGGGNMAFNGSFAANLVGWTSVAAGCSVSHNNANGPEGGSYLKITNAGYAFCAQNIRVFAGLTYTLSFWAYTAVGTSSAGAGVVCEGISVSEGINLLFATPGTAWTHYSTTFTASASSLGNILITNSYGGTATGDFYFDGVMLQEGGLTGYQEKPLIYVPLITSFIQAVPDGSTTAVTIAQTHCAEMTALPSLGVVAVNVMAIGGSSVANAANVVGVMDYGLSGGSDFQAICPGTANFSAAIGAIVATGGTNNRQIDYRVGRGAGTITYYIRVIGYWVHEV